MIKLHEVAKVNSKQIDKNFTYKDIRYIDIASVTKGNIDNIQNLKTTDAPSRAKRLVKKNDILYSTVRPNLEHYVFIKDEVSPNTVASTGFAVITPDEKIIDPYYLYCLLTQPRYTQFLSQVAEQAVSTYPTVSPNTIEDLEFNLPPLPEQKRISSILSSFDSKIEQLKKENNILEDIAKNIFKEWFVKYNFPNKNGKPYKDNNGKMIDSELGLIPEGWRVGKLGEIVSSFISGDYGKEIQNNIYDTESICIRGTDLQDVLYGNPEKAPRRFLKKKSITEKLLQPGDLILEISGGTEGQSTGRTCYINQEFLNRFNLPMTCVNFCKIIRPQQSFTYSLYSYLRYFYNKGLFFNCENGSTGIKNLSLKAVFDGIPVVLPYFDLLTTFEIKVSTIYKKIQKNNAKSSSLKRLKDNLLKSLIKQ